jgi:hypothetical protein
MASAAVFHVGCGDDDDQDTPSNGTGGKASATGGTNGTTGGKVSTGGTGADTGGKSTSTGGTAGEGSGGEPTTGGTAGAGGMPEGGSAGQGAAGGGGGTPDPGLPPCTSSDFSSAKQCYVDCDPNKTTDSEQFLNRCSEAGANCTKFDNSTLTKLGANGALPPLP